MNDVFEDDEKLYRAVYPPELVDMFWKSDGTVSSAAFADANGLSVERGGGRDTDIALSDMRKHFVGRIISVIVADCREVNALVLYKPSKRSVYHSEIHGSEKTALLAKNQRRFLAKRAVIEVL